GNFAFEKGADMFVTPVGAASTTRVSLLKIGGSGINAFAGVGDPDSNGNGRFDAADHPGEKGAIGVALQNVEFGLALMRQIGPSPTKSCCALKGRGSASLVGVDGFTLEGMLAIEVDSATDTTLAPDALAPVVDFTRLPSGKLTIATGPAPAPSIHLDYSR